MKIEIDIPAERIANLMISAMESGDPVTTAARGGWCQEIRRTSRKPFTGTWWYADPKYFEGQFSFKVGEFDEDNDSVSWHRVNRQRVADGLRTMARDFPHLFAQIIEDNTDAPCADIFLQCIVFGEEKYA